LKITKRTWISRPSGKKKTAWGYTTTDESGKQVKSFREDWTRDDAKQAYEKYVLDGGRLRAPGDPIPTMTFAQACARYLAVKRKKSLAEDKRTLESLKAEFGEHTPLAELTASRISEYKAKRLAATRKVGKGEKATDKPLTAAAINRPLALLRHLLKLAHEEWETIVAVPRIRLEKEGQGRLRWASPEEATRLLGACRESKNKDLLDLVKLTLFTGMRQSEALGLEWERVDRARGVIQLELTKGGKRREIPLNDRADAVLERRAKAGTEGYVFRSHDWNGYQTAWLRPVKRAKVTDFKFHDLRHTFASWAVQRGASQVEIKDLAGARLPGHDQPLHAPRARESASRGQPPRRGARLEVGDSARVSA
jgi:integrase